MATYNSVLTLIQTLLQTNSDITATEHRQVEEAILTFARDQWLTGDIKEVDCDNAYIAQNFDNTGKGIVGGEREGWAICNGQNGTKNRTGLVSVAYGLTAPTLNSAAFPSIESALTPGAPRYGGNKNAILISHKHDSVVFSNLAGNKTLANNAGNGAPQLSQTVHMTTTNVNANSPANVTSVNGITNTVNDVFIESSTVTGVDKNMQPYIVTLFIQKIPNP